MDEKNYFIKSQKVYNKAPVSYFWGVLLSVIFETDNSLPGWNLKKVYL